MTVLSAAGVALTLGATMLAGFSWCVRRIDGLEAKLTTRIDDVETKLTARIDDVEAKLTARIDDVEAKLTARIEAVIDDTTELKITVARLEGPARHLIVAAR